MTLSLKWGLLEKADEQSYSIIMIWNDMNETMIVFPVSAVCIDTLDPWLTYSIELHKTLLSLTA